MGSIRCANAPAMNVAGRRDRAGEGKAALDQFDAELERFVGRIRA